MKKVIFLSFFMLNISYSQYKKYDKNDYYDHSKFRIDLTLVDLPYQNDVSKKIDGSFLSSYKYLSPEQSYKINGLYNKLFYEKFYKYIYSKGIPKLALKTKIPISLLFMVGSVGLTYLDFYFMSKLPGSYYWYTSEYTKSMAAINGIDTSNPYYKFGFQGEVTANDVNNTDLIKLREQNPVALNRINASYTEARIYRFQASHINHFFRKNHQNLFVGDVLINATINSLYNLFFLTDAISKNPKNADYNIHNPLKRNVLSPDYMATFTRDLFQSNAKSLQYASYDNLNNEEKKFYDNQKSLQYLNMISLNSLGLEAIPLGKRWKSSLFVSHFLAPFGNDISITTLFRKGIYKLGFIFHNQNNYNNYYPAFDFLWQDIPFNIRGGLYFISPRILIGTQPKDLKFRTYESQILFSIKSKISIPITKDIYFNLSPEYKTSGWEIHNPYLASNFSTQVGMSFLF